MPSADRMEFRITPSLSPEEREQWGRFLQECPYASCFQSYDWGQFQKACTGRDPYYLIGTEKGQWRVIALLLVRPWPWPYASLANIEVPSGPVFSDPRDYEDTLRYLDQWACHKAVRVDLGPRWPISHVESFVRICGTLGFETADDPRKPFYPEETALVDLRRPLNDLLMSFRYTTRYEIRRAQKAGVDVRFANDAPAMEVFHGLWRRQKIHRTTTVSDARYFDLMQEHVLGDPRNGTIAIAAHEGKALSAALLFRVGKICQYRFGSSDEDLKTKMDTSHWLQWRIMGHMKEFGCETYDLCGASPSLPRDYMSYGVNIFKTGFTKRFVKFTPDFTKRYRPTLDNAFRLRHALSKACARVVGRYRI